MLPTELAILMAIVISKKNDVKFDIRSTDVPVDYINILFNSLELHGYIEKNGPVNYLLTEKGRAVFFSFLHENRTRLGDATKTLKKLGIETNTRIHEFGKQPIMV